MRKTLSLHPKPSPASQPKVDPAKASLAEALGMRFICRDHRYIFQRLIVSYEYESKQERSRTWVDVPLVPEVYVG